MWLVVFSDNFDYLLLIIQYFLYFKDDIDSQSEASVVTVINTGISHTKGENPHFFSFVYKLSYF